MTPVLGALLVARTVVPSPEGVSMTRLLLALTGVLPAAMRTLLVVGALLTLPAPSSAQDAQMMDALRRARALYPTPMSSAHVSEMLNRAISERPGWQLLRKDGGSNCPTPYTGIRISCDWIINVPAGWGYDVVQDVEGAGTIVQSDGVPSGAGISTVAPWPVGTTPQQPQEPQTPGGGGITRIDLQQLEDSTVQRLQNMFADTNARLERMFGCRDGKTPQGQDCATVQDNADAIQGVSTRLTEHDEKTNIIIAALKSAKTYLVAGSGVLGWLLPKLLSAQPPAQGDKP